MAMKCRECGMGFISNLRIVVPSATTTVMIIYDMDCHSCLRLRMGTLTTFWSDTERVSPCCFLSTLICIRTDFGKTGVLPPMDFCSERSMMVRYLAIFLKKTLSGSMLKEP